MNTKPSLAERIRTAFYNAVPGRRLTANTIAHSTAREVAAAHQPTPPARITTTPDLLTPMATSFAGVWSLARLVARSSKKLAALRLALSKAQLAYVKAAVVARVALADPRLPALYAEYRSSVETAFTHQTSIRSHRLPTWVLALILIGVAAADFAFFLQLMLDVQQVSFSNPLDYGPKLTQAVGLALLTPLSVIIVSEFGGRRVARLRAEQRARFDANEAGGDAPAQSKASIYLHPALWVAALLGLVSLFYLFATHRFEALASGPGAASATPQMLALLVSLLPIAAFAATVARHDVTSTHRTSTLTSWADARAAMVANQDAQREALQSWRTAWDALYDLVGSIVAEAQLSFQAWESLVLRGLAAGNQRGVTAYSLDSVAVRPEAGSAAGASLAAVLKLVASSGEFSVRVPERQVSTRFTSAEWVVDELEITLQSLVRFTPNPDGAQVTKDIERELRYIYPTLTAFEPEQAGEVRVTEPVTDAAEFERIVEEYAAE